MPEKAFNLCIKKALPLKNLFRNLNVWLSAGTLYTWARTKIFWIWFICTLEGYVVIRTYFVLKKVQIWNTLIYNYTVCGTRIEVSTVNSTSSNRIAMNSYLLEIERHGAYIHYTLSSMRFALEITIAIQMRSSYLNIF